MKHYMEPADKLIENNDYLEMKIAVKLGTQIISKITDLISQLEGLKLDFGASGARHSTVKEGQEERVFSLCTGSSWFIHGGVDYTDNKCMYIKEASDYKKLYSLRSARRRISRNHPGLRTHTWTI